MPDDPRVFRGVLRPLVIPPCQLSLDDLKLLAQLLATLAEEAAEKSVVALRPTHGQSDEEFNTMKAEVRQLLLLNVQVRGAGGDWIGGPPELVLDVGPMPDVVDEVTFDSAFAYRARVNQVPSHSFEVTLDFRRQRVFDFRAAPAIDGDNRTGAIVQGSDRTWANGVYAQIGAFFTERATRRGWLYRTHAYDVLLALIGFPVAILWVYRVDQWLASARTHFSTSVAVGIYVYVVIMGLYVFRLIFNYIRYMLPKYEGPRRGTRGAVKERVALVALVASWLSSAVYELVKAVLRASIGR
jgi:hypothetical protein